MRGVDGSERAADESRVARQINCGVPGAAGQWLQRVSGVAVDGDELRCLGNGSRAAAGARDVMTGAGESSDELPAEHAVAAEEKH